MNLRKLADRAKDAAEDLVDKRGGPDALKRDSQQVRAALKGPGSLKAKAKAAADAVRTPG